MIERTSCCKLILAAGVVALLASIQCLGWGGKARRPASFEASELPHSEYNVPLPSDGGIRLDVPNKLKDKFEKWKTELISTEFGRKQWETYENNKQFVLVIKVTRERGEGAGTDKYQWDESGDLVGATIFLGTDLDEGFPSPVYYPVLNALSPDRDMLPLSPAIIAAAKMSHEIGHVEQTSRMSEKLVQLQAKLIPEYVEIFLKNGRDASDNRLLDLERQMGGTPTGIWEDREYWSEVGTARYISERLTGESDLCRILKKTKQNLIDYAPTFQARFDQRPEIALLPCWN